MRVTEQYMVHTQYGWQMMVNTENKGWFILTHQTICYDGGGAAVWAPIEEIKAKELID